MTKIDNITLCLRCAVCDHEQEVTSACAELDDEGQEHYWFGSARDFCDVCGRLGTLEEL